MAEGNGARRRRADREQSAAGAEWRLDQSPWGNKELRQEWAARADGLSTLVEAVAALQSYRAETHGREDQDSLWIEARLEERAAMLRPDAISPEDFRNRTLTGEDVKQVCMDALARARAAGSDYRELERINDEFRGRYKPPIMPVNDYVRAEMLLGEQLMRVRTLDWYDKSLEDLRAERGVTVHQAPAGA